MFALKYSDELDEPVARELESILIQLKGFLLAEHNEDGTHRATALASATDPDNAEEDDDSETGVVSDATRWWRSPGPWLFDDRNAENPNAVGLRVTVPTGTYNDYAPTGINDAVVLDIEPTGGTVTLNGLRQHLGIARNKRMLLVRNSSTSQSLTLKHNNTSSSSGSRFFLPADTDITMSAGQNVWLYYDPARDGWTAAITANAAGGLSGAGGATTTNALLDGTNHTDTVAQTVTRGSLIYGNSTPKWDELVIGSANRVLKSDGTDVSWAQVNLTTDVTGVLPAANGGAGVYVATKTLSEGEIEAGNTSPSTIIAAPGSGIMAVPFYWSVISNVTAAYSTSPSWRLRYSGSSSDLAGAVVMNLANTGRFSDRTVGASSLTFDFDSFDARNKAIVLRADADPGSPVSGSATASVVVGYLLITG
jgi:hypothetical protein